jgi:hypothetical protein
VNPLVAAGFTCVSLVGLSSILISCSLLLFLGGVTGLDSGAPLLNVNGFGPSEAGVLETKEKPLPLAGAAEGAPKENAGFLSATAGGVLGAAPKAKGAFDVSLSCTGKAGVDVSGDGWPNEKAAGPPNSGLGPSGTGVKTTDG